MANRDLTKTVFGDLGDRPFQLLRVETESSVYTVAFHAERGKQYVIVRGQAGSDREHVVVRDSDPRIGDRSMFELPIADWPGKVMEVATMRTSPIIAVRRAGDSPATLDDQVRLPAPPGLSETPRIMPGLGRGTSAGDARPAPHNVAREVVVGQGAATPLPYPMRHVRYAEDVAAMLRSIHRRERLFADVAHDRELRERLDRALHDAAQLLAEIRKRAK